MFDQCYGLKYSRMAVDLGLLVHGQNGCYERSRYENTFALCGQVEDLTAVDGQLDISEFGVVP